MISASDREKAIMLINEAVENGARLPRACDALKITERTYYRWQKLNKEHQSYEDRQKYADHYGPANKLSPEERQKGMAEFVEQFINNLPNYLRAPLEACAKQLSVA